MCFSATASFIAAGSLSAAGMATLRLVSHPAQRAFAAIPLIFAVQQAVEGVIWLSFVPGSALPNSALTFLYSLFSHVLWPIYIPYAVRAIEVLAWRRRALAITQLAGILVGLFLLYVLLRFPVTSRVLGAHIAYESPHFYAVTVMGLYLIATCVSSLLASDRLIRLFGALSLATFVGAYAIHAATLVSVWCFFAALLSFIVYAYVLSKRVSPVPRDA